MKITKINIKNFKSLLDLSIDEISDLTVLIGSNSSGKSNLLEALALFFMELDPSLERSIGAIDQYLWFDRDHSRPILLELGIELSLEEADELIPKELGGFVNFDTRQVFLQIAREIHGPASSAKWKTQTVTLNDGPLVIDGKLANVKIDEGVIKLADDPTPATPASLLLQPATVGMVWQNISHKLKNKFIYIPAVRTVKSSFSGGASRTPLIDPTFIGELTRLGQMLSESRKWNDFEEYFKKTSLDVEDLRVIENQVTVKEAGRSQHFPISVIGGGYQEILTLIHLLIKEEKGRIFGVEEAELHLHPRLARQFFKILGQISSSRQIFLTTHSTIFVDQTNLDSTYIVKMQANKTVMTKIRAPLDLRNILFELGVKPSDVFFANMVLFVEGHSDTVVYPIWAEKLGLKELAHPGLSILPTRGKNTGKYHLKVWTDATEKVGIPFFMILDKGAELEAGELEKKGILKRNETIFILRDGCLEDYFPAKKLADAIRDEYNLQLDEVDERELEKRPRVESVKKLLEKKLKHIPDGWKIRIGERVANSMTPEEISEEIKSVLERIATNIRLRENWEQNQLL